jgi:GNAT superfamily N-acetyltransferase
MSADIKIVKLTQKQISEFLIFYKRSFPKKCDIVERFENLTLKNPFCIGSTDLPVLLAIDTTGYIVGQFPLMPSIYHHDGESYPCVIGYDYYVDPKLRGCGVGTKLAESAFADFGTYFGIGPSDLGRHMHAKQGLRLAGTSRTWLWLCRPHALVRLLAERLHIHKSKKTSHCNLQALCPETITFKNGKFVKTPRPSNWVHLVLDPNVIEFDRTSRFINWRYGFFSDRYMLYESNIENKQCYFAATTYWRNRLHILSIIDYRSMDYTTPWFQSILAAGKCLSRILHSDALQVVSSYPMFDNILRMRGFFRVGKPGQIWTNATLFSQDMYPTDHHIFLTLADGDGELNNHYEVGTH